MTYDQNGVLLDQTEAGNIPLKYSSITLPSTAVTLTSGNGAVAGQYTYLDVTIDIESPVPQGGKVEIMFPKWSYGVLGAPSEQSMIGDHGVVLHTHWRYGGMPFAVCEILPVIRRKIEAT